MTELAPSPSQHKFPSYGLVSLWDMWNFEAGPVFSFLKLLEGYESMVMHRAPSDNRNALLALAAPSPIDDSLLTAIAGLVDSLTKNVQSIDSHSVRERIFEVKNRLRDPGTSREDLRDAIKAVRESIEIELRDQFFYHYPRQKAELLRRAHTDWAIIFEKFPSAEIEIYRSIDCFALYQNTACVFHLMRACEVGLKTLASAMRIKLPKGKSIQKAQWMDIIKAVEDETKRVDKEYSASSKKDQVKAFLQAVSGYGRALKDNFRNDVMHVHKSFNEKDAEKAIALAKAFLEELSKRVDERNTKKLAWGLRKA